MKFKIFLFCFFLFLILTYSEEIKYKGDNIKIFLDDEGEIEKIEME